MRQAVTNKVGEVRFREVEIPSIQDTQVLLEMHYVGICGSDIHIFHGLHPKVPPSCFPLVQGHEGFGKIIEKGREVSDFEIGDMVVVEPLIGCGTCSHCISGKYNICKNLNIMGLQSDGLLSEYVVVESSQIYKVSHIDKPSTSMIEPLACAIRAIEKPKQIQDKNILVIGAGAMGNLVAQIAKVYGANKVAIVDVLSTRLELAKDKCNIEYVWNCNTENIEENITTAFGSQGLDIIFECVGNETSLENALLWSGIQKEIVVVGVFAKKTNSTSGLIQSKELTLIGTRIYTREDYEKAIELIYRDKVNLDDLIFKIIPFDECPNVYTLIDTNKERALKVLVKITSD